MIGTYMIPGGRGELSLDSPPEKTLSLDPWKFGQKWHFLIFLANPRDFHKSAVKFHEIFDPLPPLRFFRPLP